MWAHTHVCIWCFSRDGVGMYFLQIELNYLIKQDIVCKTKAAAPEGKEGKKGTIFGMWP